MKKLIITTAAFFISAPLAFAETADVSATASLEVPVTVSLAVTADIDLGVIEIPTSGSCGLEIRGDGGLFSTLGPNPQCVQSGSSNTGQLTVTCVPNTQVNFPPLVFTPGAGATGVSFNRAGMAVLQANGSILTTIEDNENQPCSADGTISIGMLFGIDVASTASAEVDVDLGTVTVEANPG